jgi:hypothetical protein
MTAIAQDSTDLFKSPDANAMAVDKSKTDYATAIFKTTRLINGQSIQNLGKGIMDVKISHRFGTLNSGAYNFFGLDDANTRIGVDYGLFNNLLIGIGRSSFEKEYDGFAKLKLLRQSTGKVNMPISVSLYSSMMIQTLKDADSSKTATIDRISYSTQLIIARKFNDFISVQLSPTLIHYNKAPELYNNIYALGSGLRIRLSKRVNLTAEYYYQLPDHQLSGTYNSFSVGFDIETGGHVFQFHLSNSTGMSDRTFITQTTDKWSDGGIHFGFNIARVFTVVKPKAFKGNL